MSHCWKVIIPRTPNWDAWYNHIDQDSLLRRIDPGKAGCSKDPNSPHACFHFSACFTVEEEEVVIIIIILIAILTKPSLCLISLVTCPQVHQMRIQFTIVAEPKKPVSRVRLAPSPTSSLWSSQILPGVATTGWGRWRGGKGETRGAYSQYPGADLFINVWHKDRSSTPTGEAQDW